MSVYSYLRYSQQGQSNEGASIERQQQITSDYATANNLVIDETFIDEGVSGFDGSQDDSNTEYSRLKAILKAGDYLLVERVTRLSRRSPITAMHEATGFVVAGITVCFCAENKKLSQDADASDMVMLSIYQGTANKESKDKSDFAKKGHVKRLEKIAKGEFTRISPPYWLTLSPTKDSYHLNEHAKTIAQIFNRYLDGVGCSLIAKELNAEGKTTAKWKAPYTDVGVHAILKNPIAYGCYHGREDYLPKAVSKDVWLRCKQILSDRKQMRTTRTTKAVNFWSGIAVCGVCGSRMHSIQLNYKYKWLVCYAKKLRAKDCDAENIREDSTETMFKEILLKIGSQNLVSVDVKAFIDKQTSLAGELAQQKLKQSSIAQALAAVGLSDTLLQSIKIVESDIATTTASLDAIEAKLKEIKDTEDSREFFLKHLDLTTPKGRLAARQHLLRLKVQVSMTRTSLGEIYYHVLQNKQPIWSGIESVLFPHDSTNLSITAKYDTPQQLRVATVMNKTVEQIKDNERNHFLTQCTEEEFNAYFASFDEGDPERDRQYKSWQAYED
jgi:DNA invertase Pin-like site-specific DNA recombinase